MQSKSLRIFLFKPLEIASLITVLLLILKLSVKTVAPLVSWWLIGLAVLIVPVLFALLFATVYFLTWCFTFGEE